MTKVTTVGNLLVKYNTIHDSYTNTKTGELVTGTLLFPDATTDKSRQTGVPPLIDRIISLFPKEYNDCTIGYLGYRDNSFNDALKTLSTNQVLNSQYRMVTNKGKTKTMFDMNKMHHRPIFLGVNVLYDPPLEYAAGNIPPDTKRTKDYYTAKDEDKADRGERDLSFSAPYLQDLQYYAGDSDKDSLILTMIRKGFSMGIGSVNAKNLDPDAELPVQFNRIFRTDEDGTGDFSVISMESTSERIVPSDTPLEEDEEPETEKLLNSEVSICIPAIDKGDGRTINGSVKHLSVKTPCIIFTGEQLDKYELASYIAVPICSWEVFKNDPYYKDSEAVKRLEKTNTCGPFIRVIAKGYYTGGASAVLSSYTEIKLSRSESKDGVKFEYAGDTEEYKNKKGSTIFKPQFGVHDTLLEAAAHMWNKLKPYKSIDDVIDDDVFYNGFERNAASSYERPIQGLFNAAELPLRFGFFRVGNDLYIRQYPASPVIDGNIQPIADDYITQLVPTYRLKNHKSRDNENGAVWFINPSDILVSSWNNQGIYTPSNQKFESTTKSVTESPDGKGFMYTYTGYLYPGPEEKKKATEKPTSVNTGLPDSIMCIKPMEGSNYCTIGVLIAPDNYLTFMEAQPVSDIARISREAYKEYIKNGAVFLINGEEPSNDPIKYVPNTPPEDMELNEYGTIEPTMDTMEVKSHIHVGIIVGIVVTVLFLIGAIIWRSSKSKKNKKPSTDETANKTSDEAPSGQ